METQTEPRKYYRTEIRIVVLSEDGPVSEDWEIHDIVHEFQHGDFSGEWEVVSTAELTPAQAAKALIEQGSDPEFFRLNEDGTAAGEEGEV